MRIGETAPGFDLPNVDGRKVSLAELLDGAAGVAVVFSCNHCPYVQAWEDRMVEIQRDYADAGIRLVAINSNDDVAYPDDSFDAMVERHRDKGFNFPYLRDETQDVARAYGAARTPEVFLVDPAGCLTYHGAIDDNYDDPNSVTRPYLRDAIDALLAGGSPLVAETQPVGCTVKWKN